MSLKLSVAPAAEPISTADAKTHLRVASSFTGDDTYIDGLVTVARRYVEEYTWRQLITATWICKLDRFPLGDDPLLLPRPPLVSVTSITYVDANGDTQTLSSSLYDVDTHSEPGLVTPVYGQVWPITRFQHHAVTVTFVAGYGAAGSNVPDDILHAMKLLIGHWYEHREDVVIGAMPANIPRGVNPLLDFHAIRDERLTQAFD